MWSSRKTVYDVLQPKYEGEKLGSLDEDPASLYQMVELQGNGGSSYPDGEWEWNGSYNVDVKPGGMGNIHHYAGSLYPYYPESQKKLNRWKRKQRGWTASLAIRIDNRFCGIPLLSGEIFTGIKKARIAMTKLIQEFENSGRFKREAWPEIIAPDRRIPILKEIDGEIWWVATTWRDFSDALVGRQSFFTSSEQPMGGGTFHTKEIRYDRIYDKGADGRTDYKTGRNIYKDTIYPQLEFVAHGHGYSSSKPEKAEAIESALWEPGASDLRDYQMLVRYEKFPGINGSKGR